MGPIPYGEVFGERFGFATVKEFLTYMDGYAAHATIDIADSAQFKAPLYVFDGELLRSYFKGQFPMGGENQICIGGEN